MDNVRLVLESDGTFSWHCDKCGVDNTETSSFVGIAACRACQRSSFVAEVVR